MAATVLDTTLQIIAATASDAGVQLALNWLNQRYIELVARARMRQNRRYGTLYAPQPITLPTVAITTGTTAVTFSSIPKDPVTGNNVSVQGWHLRVNVTWYFVTAHTSGSTSATIESKFSDATATASAITLVQRFIPVPDANTRWISSVVHPRRRKRLRYKTGEQMNTAYPARTVVGAFPWCWTEAPRFVDTLDISTVLGSTGQKFIEVYPPSNIAETYGFVYWNVPPSFVITDSLPPEIDEWVLREGVLVDVYRYKSEQWAAKGNPEMAGFYTNKEMKQRVVWENAIQQAQVTDALFHPLVPIEIDMFTDSGEYGGDITNAHDFIWSQWVQ
jgi:hypothetical protein